MMDEPGEQTCQPPGPVDVARRALILSGVVCRASLEEYTDKDYRRQTAGRVREWFDELDLWPYVEPDEEKTLRAPFGKLPRRLVVEGTWLVEGLAILAWALRRGEFPPHDRKVDPIAVTGALDFLSPDAAGLLAAPKLRPTAALEAAREWFYDVHCTLRQFLSGRGEGRLARWVGKYRKALGLGRKAAIVQGGLAFRGRPLAEADRDELEGWEAVVRERHRAAIWLVGEESPYTEIVVDT